MINTPTKKAPPGSRRVPRGAMREAPFALRIVERQGARVALVYRRRADENGNDRLQRVASISALAFTAGLPLLRDAALAGLDFSRQRGGQTCAPAQVLGVGAFWPLDANWGPRVACFGLIAAGLRDGDRLAKAAANISASDPHEAAWWLAILTRNGTKRPLRALRILTEAVA